MVSALITSGRYAVKRDRWHDIDIEIYHHPPHTANLDRMIQAVKSSLDYFTKNFSPYQFPHVRIVEIPRYADFAQSFPNRIAYSETVGFIAKVDPNDSENIDYPFYTTAHEMAHQWWGHQVISAPVRGASMLSESLAQYSALMVLKREYGSLHMKKFLKYELDRYLQGRNLSSKKESPLAWNNLEEYVHYYKGSLAFYALEDRFGEKWLNKVLQNYIKDVAFQQPPFTRAIDLVQRLKDTTSEEKKYLIEDLFETITLYNFSIGQAEFRQIAENQYEIEIDLTAFKLRSDGQGVEHEIRLDEEFEIGAFDFQDDLLALEKFHLHSGSNSIRLKSDGKPFKISLDPLCKRILKSPAEKICRPKLSDN